MGPDNNQPESKLRENLRYVGYTIPIVGGAIILGLLFLFLEPIIEFLWGIIWILAMLCAVCGFIGAIVYLIFFMKRN